MTRESRARWLAAATALLVVLVLLLLVLKKESIVKQNLFYQCAQLIN